MATTADTLITKYVLDDGAYHQGASRVVADTKQTGSAFKQAQKEAEAYGRTLGNDLNRGFANFYDKMKMGLDVAMKFVGAMVAIGAAILIAAGAAATKAAEFEALENSLRAVEGSARLAKEQMADLTEIAKLPGVDIEGAIRGFNQLRMSGLGADFSKDIIREAGNANALAGGGREQFESILRAIRQIAAKPFLQGDELLQLAEAGVPAQTWLKEALGTSDPEKLKKAGIESATVLEILTVKMQELPRATGGAKNSLENFYIALEQAQVNIGKGVISGLVGSVDDFTTAVTDLTDSGIFRWFGETIADDIGSALGLVNTGDFTDQMIQIGGLLIDVAAATRNWFIQIGNVLELLRSFMGPAAHFLPKAMGGGEAGANWMEAARGMQQAYMKREEERKKEREAEEQSRQERLKASRDEVERKRQEALDKLANVDDKKESTKHLRDISENTRKLVDARASVFGGSELGAYGISAREMSAIRKGGGQSSGIRAKVDELVSEIERVMTHQMASTLKHSRG